MGVSVPCPSLFAQYNQTIALRIFSTELLFSPIYLKMGCVESAHHYVSAYWHWEQKAFSGPMDHHEAKCICVQPHITNNLFLTLICPCFFPESREGCKGTDLILSFSDARHIFFFAALFNFLFHIELETKLLSLPKDAQLHKVIFKLCQ